MTDDDIRLYRVGGCLRDQLLGISSKDTDFAAVAPSWEALLDYVDTIGHIWQTKEDKFTVRARHPKLGDIDVVWARKEGPYSDLRRPDWVEPGTILDDLARRDFTVNAMAEDPETGELIDPFFGQFDLKQRTLRFVGDPTDRLVNPDTGGDALRAFRGIRFEITKGFFLDFKAKAAIQEMEPEHFEAVSTDRIRDELMLCFKHDVRDTLDVLFEFPNLFALALDRGIWLKPTTEGRK